MTPRDAQASGEAKISLPRTLLDQMIAAAVQAAVKEEREACARVAETQYRHDTDTMDGKLDREGVRHNVARRIAARIRSRAAGVAQ